MATVSARAVCGCLLRARATRVGVGAWPATRANRPRTTRRALATDRAVADSDDTVPLRKQLKDADKAQRAANGGKKKSRRGDGSGGGSGGDSQTVPGWELTVGIEIHAQLHTARKLFSGAATTTSTGAAAPNSQVAPVDAALPGALPVFQPATLIPAIRAALALQCAVQPVSRFDRKHYFHWDQPAGYQITQYYAPLARDGHIMLYARDGLAPADGAALRVDIVQVQMEQDTAKTVAQPGDVHWLDLNRVGAPLIEIISAPQMHHPATAAAFVRKVQHLLGAVDACTAGMEEGGLRADVNVSVRRVPIDGGGSTEPTEPTAPLGTRTEIKNLNSFRAVEDAIVAERDRQIAALERDGPGAVTSETRGWTPASGAAGRGQTHRLRGKEGAVDYRYMPDPDLAPVRVDPALVAYLRQTSGTLPDDEMDRLLHHYGLAEKDAMALVLLDGGGRAQYYYDVVDAVEQRLPPAGTAAPATEVRAFVANWVLHQLGRLTAERNSFADGGNDLGMTADGRCRIPVPVLADILAFCYSRRITVPVAKELLFAAFRGDIGDGPQATAADVETAIARGGLWFDEIRADEYRALAIQALAGEDKTLRAFVRPKRHPQGKLQFLVGKLLRLGPEGRMDPENAEAAVKTAVEDYVQSLEKSQK